MKKIISEFRFEEICSCCDWSLENFLDKRKRCGIYHFFASVTFYGKIYSWNTLEIFSVTDTSTYFLFFFAWYFRIFRTIWDTIDYI